MDKKISRRDVLTGAVGAAVGMTVLGSMAAPAEAQQTHMQNALQALTTAQQELQQAHEDKGGHRSKALDLVNHAIDQVNRGMNFANHH